MTQPGWLTFSDICAKYSFSTRKVNKLLAQGQIPLHSKTKKVNGIEQRLWKESEIRLEEDYEPSEKVLMSRASIFRFLNGALSEEEIGKRRARLIRSLGLQPIRVERIAIRPSLPAAEDRLFFREQDMQTDDEDMS